MNRPEGVVQFNLMFVEGNAPPAEMIGRLNAWRRILYQLELIGQSPFRYGGLGYGNLSIRMPAGGGNAFIISGTQTGGLARLSPEHYTRVTAFDTATNCVASRGPIPPSSESLTHGSLYRLDAAIHAVIHAHCPEIWAQAEATGIPVTDRNAAYGTPEMADAVCRLFDTTAVRKLRIFAMGGHEDGIVSFGAGIEEAGLVLIRHLALATAGFPEA